MAGKQIDFPEKQKHSRRFEMGMWAFSIVCIIFVLIAIQTVGGGGL